jgi:hypothetical protein
MKINYEKTGFSPMQLPGTKNGPPQNRQQFARFECAKTPNTSTLINPSSPLAEGNEMQPSDYRHLLNCNDRMLLYQT